MEISMFTGFTDMGMMNWNDVSFIHNSSSVEDLFVLPANYDHHQSQANQKRSAAQIDLQSLEHHQPIKHHKTNNYNYWSSYNNNNNKSSSSEIVMNNSSQDNSSSSTMLSFSNNSSSNFSNQTNSTGLINPKEEVAISNFSFTNSHQEMMFVSSSKKASSVDIIEGSPPRVGCMAQQSRDHIIAERKRREKLSQKFIALSAIIPGLKKMDKASVLGDAIKYVKQLQERVTKLEDEAKKITMESAVYVKRSYVSPQDDDDHQFSGETTLSTEGAFPEIEARISEKDVLIKIHCDKKKRVVEKIISKIEELNLIVISSSSLAFGASTLAVTIIAQMEDEFSMTAKDLVKHLHPTLHSNV